MAQQTAVEYLLEKLYTEYRFAFSGTIVDQAKQMEKEQITIKLPTDDEVEEGLFHQSNEYAIGYKDAIEFVKHLNYGSNNQI